MKSLVSRGSITKPVQPKHKCSPLAVLVPDVFKIGGQFQTLYYFIWIHKWDCGNFEYTCGGQGQTQIHTLTHFCHIGIFDIHPSGLLCVQIG